MNQHLPHKIENELRRIGVIDTREIEEPKHDPQEKQTRRIEDWFDEQGEPLF
jgi:hypothetical protein